MNQILQKRIEEAAHQYIQSDAVAPENMQLAFGDFINGAKLALQNQWISVSETLPQKDDSYFVLINNTHPRVTEFENGKWQGYDNITHWMEIPKNK